MPKSNREKVYGRDPHHRGGSGSYGPNSPVGPFPQHAGGPVGHPVSSVSRVMTETTALPATLSRIPPAPAGHAPSPPGSEQGTPLQWSGGPATHSSLPSDTSTLYTRVPPDHIYDYIEDSYLPQPPSYKPPVPTGPRRPPSSTSKGPKGADLIRRPNAYGSFPPEPPERTSSLRKKQKYGLKGDGSGVSVTNSSKDQYGKLAEGSVKSEDNLLKEKTTVRQNTYCTRRCTIISAVVVVAGILLAGGAVAAALYFLGYFKQESQIPPSSSLKPSPSPLFTGGPTIHRPTEGPTIHRPTSSIHVIPSVVPSRPTIVTNTASRPTGSAPTFMAARDCDQVRTSGALESGLYNIQRPLPANPSSAMTVYCDMSTSGGGWLLIQRRADPKVTFNRSWAQYESGFGDLTQDFWFGNELIHHLTRGPKRYVLRVELKDRNEGFGWAEYNDFRLENSSNSYLLQLGAHKGNIADRMGANKGFRFSTYDRDNDYSLQRHCAKELGGGWWFISCGYTFLNGIPGVATSRGVRWSDNMSPDTAILSVEMKIRPMKGKKPPR